MSTQRLLPLSALLLLLLPACATHQQPPTPQPKAAAPVVDIYDEKDHVSTLAQLPEIVRALPTGTGRQDVWVSGTALQAATRGKSFSACITTSRDRRVYLLLHAAPGVLRPPTSPELRAAFTPVPGLQSDSVVKAAHFEYAFRLTPENATRLVPTALRESAKIEIPPADLSFQYD